MCKSQVPYTPAVSRAPAGQIHAIGHQSQIASHLQLLSKPYKSGILRKLSPTTRMNLNLHWNYLESIMTPEGRLRQPLDQVAPSSGIVQASTEAVEAEKQLQ